MNATEIMESESFKTCVAFHGHICPGLSLGYRSATEAMDRLSENRSEDEEIVAIVETDACSADAVQVLTGCTFGKGNFIYKDHGKMVLTLLSRNTGEGVRVALNAGKFEPEEGFVELRNKVMGGDANEAENKRFQELFMKHTRMLLEMPAGELFTITAVRMELPDKAIVTTSVACARCGEPTMATKLESVGDSKVCRGCLETTVA